MADRYQLNEELDRLRAALRWAEKSLPLSQPLRPSDLYAEVITQVQMLTTNIRTRVGAAHGRPAP